MRKYATYFLSGVNITGTLAERYPLAVETQTEAEFDIVVRALRKRYGQSTIETLHHLPTSLSPHYAVYSQNNYGQYLIFLAGETERDFAQTELWKFA